MSALKGLMNKPKPVSEFTAKQLQKDPKITEFPESQLQFLQDEVIDLAPIDRKHSKEIARKMLKKHFFPPELRPSLWTSLIKNPARISP